MMEPIDAAQSPKLPPLKPEQERQRFSSRSEEDGGEMGGPPLLPLDSWHSSGDLSDALLTMNGGGSSTSTGAAPAVSVQRRYHHLYRQHRPHLQPSRPPPPALHLAAAPPPRAVAESKGGTYMQQRRAVITTIWSFVATAAFALGVVLPLKGRQATLDFTTGFLVEKALSVDNLFVFLMLFDYFKVPEAYTERVLRWGIMSALVLRGVMIAIGVAAVQRFRPVLLAFALILVVSAAKMLQPEAEADDLADNAVMKLARRLVAAQDEYDGDKFFSTKNPAGVRTATPMLVVLICIELSDVLFAVDSIPAVVGITSDPFVVYSSNIFALMALRSLYQILSKSVQQLHYLRHAVATILGFVGAKMALEFFGVHVSSVLSLGVISGLLALGTLASVARTAPPPPAVPRGGRRRRRRAAAAAAARPRTPPSTTSCDLARVGTAKGARQTRWDGVYLLRSRLAGIFRSSRHVLYGSCVIVPRVVCGVCIFSVCYLCIPIQYRVSFGGGSVQCIVPAPSCFVSSRSSACARPRAPRHRRSSDHRCAYYYQV